MSQYTETPEQLLASAPLPARSFFQQGALELARALLGCLLIHHTPTGPVGGFIVETESYRDTDDPGCHAYRGETPRNRALFLAGGHAYVYLIYGIYYCTNISAGNAGEGTGVLIRGIEPVVGLPQMMAARRTEKPRELTAGPGRLSQAMGIDLGLYGADVASPDSLLTVHRLPPRLRPQFTICQGKRIGITAPEAIELPWRFYVHHNPFVSKPWHGAPQT